MSRNFQGALGNDQGIVVSNGAFTSDGGPMTVMFYWRPRVITGAGSEGGLLRARSTTTERWFYLQSENKYFHANDFSGLGTTIPAGVFQMIGYTKANGSTTHRWHFWRASTGTWVHANSGAGNQADEGTCNNIVIGLYPGLRLDGIWICAALWNSVLSDANIEAACSPTSLATWKNFSTPPAVLLDGNQTLASDPVLDRMGGGADQTSVIGTAPPVSSTEPVGWSYNLAGAAQDLNVGFHSQTSQFHVPSIQNQSSQDLDIGLHSQINQVFAPTVENQPSLNLSTSFVSSTTEIFVPSVANQTDLDLNVSFKSSSSTIYQPTITNEGDELWEPLLLGNGSFADQMMAGLIDQGFLLGSLVDREYTRLLNKLGLAYTGAQTIQDLYFLADEDNRVSGLVT